MLEGRRPPGSKVGGASAPAAPPVPGSMEMHNTNYYSMYTLSPLKTALPIRLGYAAERSILVGEWDNLPPLSHKIATKHRSL